jgi:hypothetical protein
MTKVVGVFVRFSCAASSLFFCTYDCLFFTGLVTDHNGTYDTFLPFDQGLYTVQICLGVSTHPPWSDFPVQEEPA